MRRFDLNGVIASTGFESGDRFVVGQWFDGPIGPMLDVMWARPDGTRILLAPDVRVAEFVSAVYDFDEIRVVDRFDADGDGTFLALAAGPLRLTMRGGRGVWLPGPRPAWVTRWVERPIAKMLMGVTTYGTSPTGVSEWYRASWWRRVTSATAALDGRWLGAMGPVDPPLGVGFSEPPALPSLVRVRPLLADPTGRLDAIVDRLTLAEAAPGKPRNQGVASAARRGPMKVAAWTS